MNDGYCLVLAGGGTRGAYQLGAWNALKETGISIQAIAGTSIGAINAAFIIQGDTEKMEQLYYNINIDDVMDAEIDMKKNKSLFSISNIVKVARDYVRHKGFSNEPLRKLLENNLDLEKIYTSDIDFGLVTYSIKDHKPLEILKKDIKRDEFVQYLLASACFPIYKAQKIGENVFLDGGLYDNLPINMMIKANYKRFIVIDSSAIGMRRGLISKDVYIKFIRPSESLGGIFEFDREKIKKNILLGYLDTLKAFSRLQGHRYYFKTDDFNEVLMKFNLQTIAGLEFAAKVYGMDQYKIYNSNDFFSELLNRHHEATERYNKIKKVSGITAVIKEYESIKHLLHKDLILCFFIDKISDEPLFSAFGDNIPFSDYIAAGRALIELENQGY
ncbi:MAG: patatin-like phospholipase family protein [Clostridiaceae bacterium]|nr:patatin-like phospholipase family protein [Clostridiaceae bacterium]